MKLLGELERYRPCSEQEEADRRAMLSLLRQEGAALFQREHLLYHFTASGFVLNPGRNKVLMAYHNLYQSWAWTGGHADGEWDLLAVALREAREEAGISQVEPLFNQIASLEILPVKGHRRRGRYVGAHLHLNVSYLLIAPENQPLSFRPEENSGVRWIPHSELEQFCTEPDMLVIYEKLICRAKKT